MHRTRFFDHLILLLGAAFLVTPVLVAFMTSTHTAADIHMNGLTLLPGGHGVETYHKVLTQRGGFTGEVTGARMLMNSTILGLGFAVGKIVLSMMAAYALVYFRFRFATVLFWMIFATLLLPLEVRIMPSYQVMSQLHLLNSYTGLIVPLLASATGTFFFRQFFKSVPDELLEAARIDGAGPWKFFVDVLVPLSKTMMAAIFIIMFIYGWNQYLWPLLVTTDESYYTIVMGIQRMANAGEETPQWHLIMSTAILALLPPVAVIIGMQSLFVRGLVEVEK
jgi:sn-glycerol 3-phosphate transport system permease protein